MHRFWLALFNLVLHLLHAVDPAQCTSPLRPREERRCADTLSLAHDSLRLTSSLFRTIRNDAHDSSTQPFLPPSSPLLILFPLSREWAIRLPALILLFGLCFVGMITGFVLIETATKKEQERRAKLEARSETTRVKEGKGD